MADKLQSVPVTGDFPALEAEVLSFWRDQDVFQEQLRRSEGRPVFSFFDGPPFATGDPHYGHLLQGAMKDVVTRFACASGHHVPRVAGWDTHGLPIEFKIDQKLGINTPQQVEEFGIGNYNEECRKIVLQCADVWEKTAERLGRWIDYKNAYMTMSKDFMESVWWVISEMWKNTKYHEDGLIYRGVKVMAVSTGCGTPISNFEAGLNYKDVNDTAITVSFPLKSDPEVSLLAWTTTPWTLPSNLCLCVNKEMQYVKFRDAASGRVYIMAEERLVQLYPKPKGKKGKKEPEARYEILDKFAGEKLVGEAYEPLFHFFDEFKETHEKVWTVLEDDYVSADAGTGIVHIAPYFGEEDFGVCMKHNVISRDDKTVVCPVDFSGCFTEEVPTWAGKYIKDSDKEIITDLKNRERCIQTQTIKHSYPFCWRSETPLIYMAVPSWFVRVESMREDLVKNNMPPAEGEEATGENPRWVPGNIQTGRFHNWLKDARDWNISRNRYWGTPIPIWHSEDHTQYVVVGSAAELEEKAGLPAGSITDIHRHFIDDITIPDPRGPEYPPLRRDPSVCDCWLESGSMPYAQHHYPFENHDLFEQGFPADFIGEGLDQTRGWFYTLMVIGTALFGHAPFKNLICTGIILAEDGEKMSKSKQNYPDPNLIFDKFGADALRLYLINSPVVRAEYLYFSEKGVADVRKEVFGPYFSVYRFFVQNAKMCPDFKPSRELFDEVVNSTDDSVLMDRWVLAALAEMADSVRNHMGKYELFRVLPVMLGFIESLSNIYVRLNRSRIKGQAGIEQQRLALNTLYYVLMDFSRVACSFIPFLTEHIWRNLRCLAPSAEYAEESVHYTLLPEYSENVHNPVILRRIENFRRAMELGRLARIRAGITTKQPIKSFTFVNHEVDFINDIEAMRPYLLDELNTLEIKVSQDERPFATLGLEPDMRVLGKRLGGAMRKLRPILLNASHELCVEMRDQGYIEIDGSRIDIDECKLLLKPRDDLDEHLVAVTDPKTNISLAIVDATETEELVALGQVRNVVATIQKGRKLANLEPSDLVDIFVQTEGIHTEIVKQGLQKLRGNVHFVDTLPTEGECITDFGGENGRLTENVGSQKVEIFVSLHK